MVGGDDGEKKGMTRDKPGFESIRPVSVTWVTWIVTIPTHVTLAVCSYCPHLIQSQPSPTSRFHAFKLSHSALIVHPAAQSFPFSQHPNV